MFSYITTVFPASVLPSNTNSTSTVPLAFFALNVAVAVTSAPASSLRASPVVLSIAVPVTLYVSPGTRFRYATLSTIWISFSARVSFVAVFSSMAVVFTDGM